MDSSTSTMADQLSLPLQAWPAKDPNENSLPYLISRINAQRGSFRNITEESLQEEIEAIETGQAQPELENTALSDSEDDDAHDATPQTEDVQHARGEILKFIAQAQWENVYALDFISLLLSKHTPKQAEVSISPVLKQNVPMGSVAAELVQLPPITETKRRDDSLVSTGWKLQSLKSASDSLLRSATRLEKELEQETRYWDQVLAIKEKGWSLCRLPREKHTLGVRYGFSEASREFRDRGLAALRRTEGGKASLDLGIGTSISRILRVQVQKNAEILSTSRVRKVRFDNDESIESSILQARNDIFDEELFHELHREARSLTNRGVRCLGNMIILPMEDEKQIVIELVNIGDIEPEEQEKRSPGFDIAEILAVASRILLTYAHRESLNRRSQPQPPLTERRAQRPLYPILRPILVHLQYRSALTDLEYFLMRLGTVLAKAKLSWTWDNSSSAQDTLKTLSPTLQPNQPFVEGLLQSLHTPLQGSIALTLPSTSSRLTIHTRTHAMGTEYKVDVSASNPNSPLSTIPQGSHFSSISNVEDHILHLLSLDLVSLIETSPDSGNWIIASPHTGQLRIDRGSDGRGHILELSMDEEALQLQWNAMYQLSDEVESEAAYVWRKDDVGKESRGLLETAKTFADGTGSLRAEESG